MKIVKCDYNWDNGTVDIIFSDGTKMALLCRGIEAEIEGSLEVMGRIEALKVECPLEYAQMALNETMQEYCRSVDRSSAVSADIVFRQYKKRYPNMSEAQIRSLIRECQMYDN